MRMAAIGVALLLACNACGGNSSPAAPGTPATPATPTVNGLTISGLVACPTGLLSRYIATATLSNGTTQDVTTAATWTTDNRTVGTVDNAGALSLFTNGAVTLSAAYQGRSASMSIRAVSNFGGTWSGTYILRTCDQSGSFASNRWCQSLGVGSILPFSLALVQGGPLADQISGTLALGGLSGNVTGNVTGDGRLNIGGTSAVTISPGFAAVITVGDWNSSLSSSVGMTGSWATDLKATGSAGNAFQTQDIVSASHLTILSGPVSPAPTTYQLSWSDLVRSLRERTR